MSRKTFFTDAYLMLTADDKEAFYKTVFLNMDTESAAKLRQEYYSGILRYMGKNVKIGCGVKMVNPEFITLGDNVQIGDNCLLEATTEKGITIEDDALITYGVSLRVTVADSPDSYIHIGKRVYIGTGCSLYSHRGLEIGEDTLFAQNITLTPYSHKFDDKNRIIKDQGGHSRKVAIGRDCYIGMGSVILYSADIGEGSVIGSGTLVLKPVPPYSVAVGVPARVIRKRGDN